MSVIEFLSLGLANESATQPLAVALSGMFWISLEEEDQQYCSPGSSPVAGQGNWELRCEPSASCHSSGLHNLGSCLANLNTPLGILTTAFALLSF